MRSKICLMLVASALGACGYTPHDLADRGVDPVNVPVVERTNYALDLAAPGGTLAPGEASRLKGWFHGLALGYGDSVFVDGASSDAVRADVAQASEAYGMLLQDGAPITQGGVAPGTVRVIVSRARATVPNCPNWSRDDAVNYQNRSSPNLGCSVNGNLAAMIANPEDLVYGQENGALVDPRIGTKAVDAYRNKALSGASGAVK